MSDLCLRELFEPMFVGLWRRLEVSLLYGDIMKKIGLRFETSNGRDVKAGLGYFRRF